MSDDLNGTPAGAPDTGILSLSAAVEKLDALDREEQGDVTANTVEAAAEAVEDAASEPDGKGETPEPDQDASEDAKAEEVYLSGNAKTRLRDGREVTLADLKKAFGELEEVRAKTPDALQKEQDIAARLAQIQQQEQFYQQAIAHAVRVSQSKIPAEPDPSLRETDPIEYLIQKDARDKAIAEFNQLRHAQQVSQDQARRETEHNRQKAIVQEFQALREKAPEFRDDAAFKSFREDVLSVVPREYGIKPEELTEIGDHRALLVIRDAIAYRKLQADKAAKIEEAKKAPPVQVAAPGRRVSQDERADQARKEQFQRLKKTGSIDDALAILNSA